MLCYVLYVYVAIYFQTFLGIHYETQVSSFTLVEDVYKRLKITENNLPRMMLLKRVQAALGNTVDLFGFVIIHIFLRVAHFR